MDTLDAYIRGLPDKPSNEKAGQLVSKARGDYLDRAELARSYLRCVVSMAIRLAEGDRYTAVDLLQEAYIHIYTRIPGYHRVEGASFASWAINIAINRMKDVVRAKRRYEHRFVQSEGYDPSLEDLSNEALGYSTVDWRRIDIADAMDEVSSAMDDLSERQRMSLTLFYLQGLSLKDVALELGITYGTVRQHKSRAINRLRKRLPDLVREDVPV